MKHARAEVLSLATLYHLSAAEFSQIQTYSIKIDSSLIKQKSNVPYCFGLPTNCMLTGNSLLIVSSHCFAKINQTEPRTPYIWYIWCRPDARKNNRLPAYFFSSSPGMACCVSLHSLQLACCCMLASCHSIITMHPLLSICVITTQSVTRMQKVHRAGFVSLSVI